IRRLFRQTERAQPINSISKRKRGRLLLEALEDRTVPSTLDVALTGNDATGDGSAANPFRTIQHAIGAASPGDTIQVATGVYNGTGDVEISIPAPLTGLTILGGFDPTTFDPATRVAQSTIYIPQQAGNILGADVDVFANSVTIDGFNFIFDGGTVTTNPDGTLQNEVHSNRQSAGIIVRGTGFDLNRNAIEVGSSTGSGTTSNLDAYGLQTLFNSAQDGLTITGNTFTADQLGFIAGAIYPNPGPAPLTPIVVNGNTITGGRLSQGIAVDTISNVEVTHNTFTRTAGSDDAQQQQFIFAGPFTGSADQSNVIITDNTL